MSDAIASACIAALANKTSSAFLPEAPLPPGHAFGEFTIQEAIGLGGVGIVYRAIQNSLDRVIALKIMTRQASADKSAVRRFRREVRLLAQLSHPNLVHAINAGLHDGCLWLAMEYVDGEDLLDSVARRGMLPEDEVLKIGIGVAAALAFADRHNVVHRDVKSANILLGRNGDVKLSDLGFAWQRGKPKARLTQPGCVVGTPFYISPEQALGESELDIRSDLYSLGICMYEALTGRVPFSHANALEVMCQHVNNPPPPLHKIRMGLHPETYAAIDKLLAKDREQRFAHAEQLIEALQAILGSCAENSGR